MHKPHITEGKRKEVQDIINLVKKYKVIGVVDMCDLPALQLQKIKYQFEDVVLKFTKKRFIKIAFDQLKNERKNIEVLKEKLAGMPALLFSDKDPFELAKIIKKNQSNAPAKSGQIAPMDLIVPAGPTDFMAGPMIGELGALGIKTKVENGKLTIINDKLLVKEGEAINEKQAALLSKVGIQPMKVGLNLLLTYDNGEILSREILFVDEELYINNLKLASMEAVTLAMEINYVVKDTAELLIMKAYREAKALGDKAKIDEIKEPSSEEPFKKAFTESVHEEKKEEKKIEEKVEEKPKEIKPGPVKEEPIIQEKPMIEEKVEKRPEEVKQEVIQEIKKEEPKQIEEKKIIEEAKQVPIVLEKKEHKETALEKEIREQKEIKEEQAPRDEEDGVVIESKKDYYEQMADNAKVLLNKLVDEKLAKQEPIKKIDIRPKKEIENVNEFINELKDKKAKGEL